jgi:hypothetical protein
LAQAFAFRTFGASGIARFVRETNSTVVRKVKILASGSDCYGAVLGTGKRSEIVFSTYLSDAEE